VSQRDAHEPVPTPGAASTASAPPTVLGIDEHLFRRYKNRSFGWVTTLVDFDHTRLFELVEGKGQDELAAALGEKRGRERVEFVVMDLSAGYRQFVRSFFRQAQIVVDKFHVVRLFSRLVSRKRIDATGDERTNPIRSLLMRNRRDLERHEVRALDLYLSSYPDVREVYELKEAMGRLYRMKGIARAAIVFRRLLDRMGHSRQRGVLSLRETLLAWRHEILAYFTTGLTNARTEGFNNKAKLVKRRAFGYRSFEHYRLRLLKACA
jgi:transposase